MIVRSLLHDGALRMEVHPELLRAASPWIPLLPEDTPADPAGAVIRVLPPDGSAEVPATPPTLRMGGVSAWLDDARALLASASGLRGRVHLEGRRAELRVDAREEPDDPRERSPAGWDLHSACTLAAALLAGRLGRALAHSAAVVGPDGRAWLLVGDSHAGKTTTSVNLLQAGWRYVSDDQVVLYRAEGELRVEGWPRPFHLDEGWEGGTPLHRRGTTDPRERWPGRWLRTAPLGGLLFPRVEAGQPTVRQPVAPADALGRLLRQSPWLLADRGAAAGVLRLLQDAASLPAYALRLGLDTYADPARLARVLA